MAFSSSSSAPSSPAAPALTDICGRIERQHDGAGVCSAPGRVAPRLEPPPQPRAGHFQGHQRSDPFASPRPSSVTHHREVQGRRVAGSGITRQRHAAAWQSTGLPQALSQAAPTWGHQSGRRRPHEQDVPPGRGVREPPLTAPPAPPATPVVGSVEGNSDRFAWRCPRLPRGRRERGPRSITGPGPGRRLPRPSRRAPRGPCRRAPAALRETRRRRAPPPAPCPCHFHPVSVDL